MISILAQERLLGFTLGGIFAGVVVFEQRKRVYKSISDNFPPPPAQSQMSDPNFGKKPVYELACLWNKAVDQTFGPVIEALGSRGW